MAGCGIAARPFLDEVVLLLARYKDGRKTATGTEAAGGLRRAHPSSLDCWGIPRHARTRGDVEDDHHRRVPRDGD